MTNKKWQILLVSIFVAGALRAADTKPPIKNEQTKAAMKASKKKVIAENMILTPEQEKIFWPMYDDFQIEVNKLNAEREAVVTKFAVNYNMMTDDLATELVEKAIDLDKQRVDLKKSLVSQFSKKFPPKVVARYFQLESKFDSMIMAEAAQQVPLAK